MDGIQAKNPNSLEWDELHCEAFVQCLEYRQKKSEIF